VKQTITEKIFSKASGRQVKAGDIVTAKVDRLMTMDTVEALVFMLFDELGVEKIYDPELLVVIMDHLGCGHNLKDAETIKKARECAKKYGVKHLYDLGNNGVCHQIMVEEGFVQPGKLVVGTDSHSTTYGALGAISCGVTYSEAAVILATGESWFRVPPTIKIELTGELPFGVSGKDVALKMINILGCEEKAIYNAVEIGGPGAKRLEIEDRLTICNMVAELGAKNGIIAGDEKTVAYLKGIAKADYEIVESDVDAEYEAVYEINLSELEPIVAAPYSQENIHTALDLENVKIDHVFLGSCTNGRLEDLRLAAKVLEGKKIADGVRMIVVPASQKIYLEALQLGYIETFIRAGALVESSSCASCMGQHTGVLAAGEVAISTTNRNTKGRMGSPSSLVYLASAATAAAAAVEGHITDPRKYLK
jgi:3-isopropylmalate/(R)-2-methylmalate dehydratase large subunit